MKNIAIIGAGWYGCHIGNELLKKGHQVTVFEKENDIFMGASGFNQNRLHVGYHYARNFRTRMQSLKGFKEFINFYPTLSGEIKDNIYSIPKNDSLLDCRTYLQIMNATGIFPKEVDPKKYGIINCTASYNTEERVIYIDKAKEYFKKSLNERIILATKVGKISNSKTHVFIGANKYDYVIDCTWGQLQNKLDNIFYELCLLVRYSVGSSESAHTFVDGSLCSLYPTQQKDIFTLSSVLHTPLGQYSKYEDCITSKDKISEDLLSQKREKMEQQLQKYFQDFLEKFKFLDYQVSIKTKISGADDDRSCYITSDGRIIRVMSGKIDNIFWAFKQIKRLIDD